VAFRSPPLQATYSLSGPRSENHLHFLTFSTRESYCESHRFFDNKNTRTTRARVTCRHLVHPYCYPCPNPCVSAYRTVTRPSGGQRLCPVDSGLDTDWTEPYARARVFSARGRHGGLPAPPYMRKHFTNLCRNLWDALQAPRRAL
jgi:hypothetical protein